VKVFNTISDYKLKGFSFILNESMIKPHWEVSKRRCYCRLCGSKIEKGEKRFALEVDFDHPYLSTYYYIFMRFYFCQKHSVKEIEKELGIKIGGNECGQEKER